MSATITYDASWFIFKFSAIPEDEWCMEFHQRVVAGKLAKCALGHCGLHENSLCWPDEATRLDKILHGFTPAINDGADSFDRLGKTPKQRILAALRQAKAEGR